MRFGLDLLGAAQYVDVVIKNVPRELSIGIFHSEFDKGAKTGFRAVQQFAKAGFTFFRIQMIWDKDHNYGDKYIPQLKQIAALYQKFATNHPDCTVQLSPFCEHRLPDPDTFCDVVAKLAPHCEVVNCPIIGQGKRSAKYKTEIHGSDAAPLAAPYNFSFDGNGAQDANVQAIKEHLHTAENFFLWAPCFNLHANEADRDRNTPPTVDYMKSILFLATDKGSTSLPKDWLYKTHSEKAYMPVMIAPIKADNIFLRVGDKVVGTLKFYAPYVDGRSRFYSTQWGYLTAQKYGLVDVWANDKKIGVINSGFRDGDYR